VKIIVPMVPPSGNQMRRRYRHPFAYLKLRDTWKHNIWALGPRFRAGNEKMDVTIHVEHSRLYDEDNLIAGCKPILDSLKSLCYIKDDSPAFIELKVTQAVSREKQTTIEVRPA
jgi:hypothetical protein